MFKLFNSISKLSGGVASNTMAALLVRGITIATRWAIIFVIAKFTAPEVFGMVALAMTVAEITKVAADLGVDYFSIRQFAVLQSKIEEQKLVGTLLVVKICYGFICYSVLASYFLITQESQQGLIGIITGLLIITSLLCTLPISYYQAKLNIIKLLAPVIVVNFIASVAVVILLRAKISIIYVICILPVSELVLAGFLLSKLHKEITIAFSSNIGNAAIQLTRKALPIGITSIFIVLYSRIDIVIIKHLTDLSSVGFYGFAFRISEPFQFIAANYSISVYSHVSAELRKGKESVKQLARKYLAKSFGLGCASFVVCILLAHVIVRTVYGKYSPSLPIINVLAFLLVMKALNSTLTAVIHAYGNFTVITKLSAFNFMFVSSIMICLVSKFGAIGAAYALVIGEIVNSLLQLIIEKKLSHFIHE